MLHVASSLVHHFVRVDTILIGASWLSALTGLVVHYRWQHQEPNKSFRGLLKFALPSEIWLHPSCRRDYVFAGLNHVVESFTVVPVVGGVLTFSLFAYEILSRIFGSTAHPVNIHWPLYVALLFVMIMIQDFATWFSHFLEHHVPVLWKFHMVHHSAEFMTPISNRRHHPLQLIWESVVSNALAGTFIGIASYIAGVKLISNLFLGMDGYYLASVLSFYQLRHSHVPLHYGKFDKWLLSPAAHQLHHSVEKQDWDKNFGLLTSIWDRLFGTFNVVRVGYEFNIGLKPSDQKQFQTVASLWLSPFLQTWKLITDKFVSTGTAPIRPKIELKPDSALLVKSQ
jgi:sterol desaturase/sphingolipid hydroxylase (fatty acid hydroxylase superfamily)